MEVGNVFFTKKKFFLYTHAVICAPKVLRSLIAAQCVPIASTCPVPLVQNATMALSSNCPDPTMA